MSEDNTKEHIISVVMEMLDEGLQAETLTTRKIAQRAKVGVGLINYHFQTKEKLINAAVARYMEKTFKMSSEFISSLSGTPKQKLISLSKYISGCFARNPSVTRISLLHDLASGNSCDNIQNILKTFEPLILEIIGNDKYWAQLIGSIFCFTFSSAFLRADVLNQTAGFDFFDNAQREKFVEDTVETLLQNII